MAIRFPESASKPAKTLTIEKSQLHDCIHLEQLEVFVRVGVPEEERAAPQRLTFNITAWPLKNGAELHDEISRAVNYAAVCAETKKFVSTRRDRLIETLADGLAMHLLQRFEIQKVAIEVRKFVLPEVEYVSVTVTRERPA